MNSCPNFESVHCSLSSTNCCLLTCIQVSQEAGKLVWYSYLFKNFPQIVVTHTAKALFILVNEVKVDVFLKFPCFFMIHWMLAIWCLVPLPFLNLACTSRCYQFMYCWILDPVLLILEGRSTYVLVHNEELSPDRDVSLSYSKGLLFIYLFTLSIDFSIFLLTL